MKQPGELPTLQKLGSDIRALHAKTSPAAKPRPTGMGFALQVSLELVAGVGVGSFIGFTLDKWLGTSPWLFLVCFFLGAAGGALTLYRTATAFGAAQEAALSETSDEGDR